MFSLSRANNLVNSKIFKLKGSDPILNQVRNLLWADWRMAKDARKRNTRTENADLKLRMQVLRKNTILPQELRSLADQEMNQLPRDCLGTVIRARCGFTSRGNGNVIKWRVSRIIFRDLADHNRLSGTQRALW